MSREKQIKILGPWEENELPCFPSGSIVRKQLGKFYKDPSWCECRIWKTEFTNKWKTTHIFIETFDTREAAIAAADKDLINKNWTLIDSWDKIEKLKVLI